MRRFDRVAVLFCDGTGALLAQVPGGVKPAVGGTSGPGMSERTPGSDAYGPWPSRPAQSPMMNLPFQGPIVLHPNQPGVGNHREAATGALLYKHQVAGAVGMHNGFFIADLDPTAPGNELYAAGSLGLWKWVRQ